MKLTVTVITRDEAANIAAALQSVSWADEIIVVDSQSRDETVSIARKLATRVEVREWPGYSAQKNYAASMASNDWIRCRRSLISGTENTAFSVPIPGALCRM